MSEDVERQLAREYVMWRTGVDGFRAHLARLGVAVEPGTEQLMDVITSVGVECYMAGRRHVIAELRGAVLGSGGAG